MHRRYRKLNTADWISSRIFGRANREKRSIYTPRLFLFGRGGGWRGRLRGLGGLLLGLGGQFVAQFEGEPVSRLFLSDRGTITDDRVHAFYRWQILKWVLPYQRVSE
jgi:hypothetical protein